LKVNVQLAAEGWRVLHIWECALIGPERLGVEHTIDTAAEWIRSDEMVGEIRGLPQAV
jgi:DNA mismatch endonuclease (patch repair protein)